MDMKKLVVGQDVWVLVGEDIWKRDEPYTEKGKVVEVTARYARCESDAVAYNLNRARVNTAQTTSEMRRQRFGIDTLIEGHSARPNWRQHRKNYKSCPD